jgi:hypothetical protein
MQHDVELYIEPIVSYLCVSLEVSLDWYRRNLRGADAWESYESAIISFKNILTEHQSTK